MALTIVLAAFGFALSIVSMGASHLTQKTDNLNEQRVLLGTLNQILDQMPNGQQLLAAQIKNINGADFLDGPSETVIRATLQQQFNQLAIGQNVSVISVGNAPNFNKNGISYVGLQANVSGTIGGLHHTLFALESAQPLLFVTKLTVRSTAAVNGSKPTSEPVLIAQLRLYGALQPEIGNGGKATQ